MGGRAGKPSVAAQTLPPATRQWTARERAIVELHHHYLTQQWGDGDWKIYARYKKHLAPEYRGEVDRLVDFMAARQAKAFRVLHETILATIWDEADWLALLEDPAISVRGRGDAEQRAAWQARVARVRDLTSS